jgi:hypothetical protein
MIAGKSSAMPATPIGTDPMLAPAQISITPLTERS